MSIKEKIKKILKRIDRFLHQKFSSDGMAKAMNYDRAFEYSFVIKHINNESRTKRVLDIGSGISHLTTAIAALGFEVDAVDLLETPLNYPNVHYYAGNFIDPSLIKSLKKNYDILVLCSTIEHFGLKRYGSKEIPEADLECLKIVKTITAPDGKIIITIPYGIETVVAPFHRIYNKKGQLMQYLKNNFALEIEEYYKINEQNKWIKTTEAEAGKVSPSDNIDYALGLFIFRNK